MTQKINIKDLRVVKCGTFNYLKKDANGIKDYMDKVVIFPTAKELLDAFIENGKHVEKVKESFERNKEKIKQAEEALGNLERVAMFILSYNNKKLLTDLKLTEDAVRALDDLYLDWIFKDYIEYCIYSGEYMKELVTKKIDKLIPDMYEERTRESAKQLFNMLYIKLDNDIKAEYCGISDDIEVELDDFLFMLNDKEKKLAKQEIKDNKVTEKSKVIKSFVKVLNEIMNMPL